MSGCPASCTRPRQARCCSRVIQRILYPRVHEVERHPISWRPRLLAMCDCDIFALVASYVSMKNPFEGTSSSTVSSPMAS